MSLQACFAVVAGYLISCRCLRQEAGVGCGEHRFQQAATQGKDGATGSEADSLPLFPVHEVER